jgi:hypothetical protein
MTYAIPVIDLESIQLEAVRAGTPDVAELAEYSAGRR